MRSHAPKPTPTHGGARKGAGRPSAGRLAYRVRMKPAAMAALRKQAKAGGHAHVGALMEAITLQQPS